jgi:branched-chain amino acid transport system permease protein
MAGSQHATLRIAIGLRRGILSIVEIVIVGGCIFSAFFVTDRYVVEIMVRTSLWAGLGLAWNIAGGYTGLISFGHAAFFGIGAYTSTILLVRLDISPWLGVWVGALIAAAAAALLTAICARLRGPFFILSTLAAAEVTRIAALNWQSLTGGSEGLEISPVPTFAGMVFENQEPYLALMIGYMLVLFALSKWIECSRFGYYLLATRDEEEGAAAIGIRPGHIKVLAMGLSGGLTGIGGTLFAQYFLYLDPTHIISPDISFQFALICALGGLGTAIGPVLGALVIVPCSELLRGFLSAFTSGLHLAIYGAIVIAVMLYFPAGIAGGLARGLSRLSHYGSTGMTSRKGVP